MSQEFDSQWPKLESPALKAIVGKDNRDFTRLLNTEREINISFGVVEAAKKVIQAACKLEENAGKEGAIVALTKREIGYPILTFQIGKVNQPDKSYGPDGKRGKYSDFADCKVYLLQIHPEYISSGQNSILPEAQRMRAQNGTEIPEGAIAINEWIIGVSGFDAQMDTACAIAIAAGSGLINIDGAWELAEDPNVNGKKYMRYEDELYKLVFLP